MFDYVAGKADWLATGLPREGESSAALWAGDLVRNQIPSCEPETPADALQERVAAGEGEFWVVLDENKLLLGLVRSDALEDPSARAEDVMELGPTTIRPSRPVESLLESRQGAREWLVTTPRGVLLGVLSRTDAERALEEQRLASRSA